MNAISPFSFEKLMRSPDEDPVFGFLIRSVTVLFTSSTISSLLEGEVVPMPILPETLAYMSLPTTVQSPSVPAGTGDAVHWPLPDS